MMTARLKYIRARTASRFQSILFCLIQMHILTSIQTAVKVNSAEKKDTAKSSESEASKFFNKQAEEEAGIEVTT